MPSQQKATTAPPPESTRVDKWLTDADRVLLRNLRDHIHATAEEPRHDGPAETCPRPFCRAATYTLKRK